MRTIATSYRARTHSIKNIARTPTPNSHNPGGNLNQHDDR